jgi:hypothetical protein
MCLVSFNIHILTRGDQRVDGRGTGVQLPNPMPPDAGHFAKIHNNLVDEAVSLENHLFPSKHESSSRIAMSQWATTGLTNPHSMRLVWLFFSFLETFSTSQSAHVQQFPGRRRCAGISAGVWRQVWLERRAE